MTTTVINIRCAPSGWQNDPRYQYIGRPGKGMAGPFGNPLRTIDGYPEWLLHTLATNPHFRQQVAGLHGKILVCFCKPKPCHGDFLAVCADAIAVGLL